MKFTYSRQLRPLRLCVIPALITSTLLAVLYHRTCWNSTKIDSHFRRNISIQPHNNNIYLVDLPNWIHDYCVWHAKALTEPPSKHRFLVYHCSKRTAECGGVGDRLRGILSLFYIAIASNRVFLIDYTHPFPLNATLEENLVQWSSPMPRGPFIRMNSYGQKRLSLIEPSKMSRRHRVYVATSNSFYPNVLWRNKAMQRYLRPYETSANAPPQLFKWAFHALFRKNRAVQRRIGELRLQIGLERVHQPYVGIHVRLGTGDAATWTDPRRHSMLDLHRFLRCGHRMQRFIEDGRNRR